MSTVRLDDILAPPKKASAPRVRPSYRAHSQGIHERVKKLVHSPHLMRECLMSCPSCASLNQAEFAGELMLHFSGPTPADKPSVLTFPKILVCMDCGASRFSTSDADLRELREGMAPAA
jgi:hypothetical protein